jgi:hypothetical protein
VEKRVLKLLALGRSVKEMAAELAMPPDMVRGHGQNVLVKLGVHSRLEPPPLPPAASAALAVPIQKAEDVQHTSVRPCVRRAGRHSTEPDRLRGGPDAPGGAGRDVSVRTSPAHIRRI